MGTYEGMGSALDDQRADLGRAELAIVGVICVRALRHVGIDWVALEARAALTVGREVLRANCQAGRP